MSYYQLSNDVYRSLPAALPGWQHAPVPGWGMNPMRSGPPRVGVGGTTRNDLVLPRYAPLAASEDVSEETLTQYTAGHVAFGIALGILSGLFIGWQARSAAR